jgi:protein pelota
LECERFFKLTKASWDSLSLEIIRQSTSDAGKYDVVAVLLQEPTAYICTVTGESSLKVVKKIEENLPKKRIGSAYEKGIDKFYSNVIAALLESFELRMLKAIILASPGSFRDELYKRLMDLAVKDESKKFINENKAKFIKVQVSNGQLPALEEALKEPRIASLLEGTKTAREAKCLDTFHKLDKNSEGLTEFGWNPVLKAAKLGAIKMLLLSDSLFRSLDVKERKQYIELVEEVKDNGGSIQIFVTGTETEKELAKLSGVAAILNFSIE